MEVGQKERLEGSIMLKLPYLLIIVTTMTTQTGFATWGVDKVWNRPQVLFHELEGLTERFNQVICFYLNGGREVVEIDGAFCPTGGAPGSITHFLSQVQAGWVTLAPRLAATNLVVTPGTDRMSGNTNRMMKWWCSGDERGLLFRASFPRMRTENSIPFINAEDLPQSLPWRRTWSLGGNKLAFSFEATNNLMEDVVSIQLILSYDNYANISKNTRWFTKYKIKAKVEKGCRLEFRAISSWA